MENTRPTAERRSKSFRVALKSCLVRGAREFDEDRRRGIPGRTGTVASVFTFIIYLYFRDTFFFSLSHFLRLVRAVRARLFLSNYRRLAGGPGAKR